MIVVEENNFEHDMFVILMDNDQLIKSTNKIVSYDDYSSVFFWQAS